MFQSVSTHNPNKDYEVSQPPEDSISKIAFSPNANYLVSGSWNNTVRCHEVQDTGATMAKAETQHTGPVLDCCWISDGTKVLSGSCDKTCKLWDLQTNQAIDIGSHDAPIKSVRWIEAPNYKCAITGSWDKTIKFWDCRQPNPSMTLNLPERCYCLDVMYPLAVVGTAGRHIIIYNLENQPQEVKTIESPLKYQHRCVSIFKDKNNRPTGFALGSIEGRVAIQYINPLNPTKDNFTFKCHRSVVTTAGQTQDIYAVNDIAFHPSHGTLATVGSDGRYYFWDKDARTKLKDGIDKICEIFYPQKTAYMHSEAMDQPITSCCFNHSGLVFAYAVSYDWSKGHEHYNPAKKNYIFLRQANEDLRPRTKKR